MTEAVAWRDLRIGDVLEIAGARWTVRDAQRHRGQLIMTLKSQTGGERTGRPDPAGLVSVVERGPEPAELAVKTLAPLKPEPLCSHWIGDEERHCGSDREVRLFLNGHRCPDHTPGLVQARASGRKACLGCGQPVPDDEEPGQKCVICKKSTTAKAARGKR